MFWFGAIVSLCYVPGVTGAYIATQWPLLAVALSFDLMWAYAAGRWPAVAGLLPSYQPRKGVFTAFHAAGLMFVAYAFVRSFYTPAPDASMYGVWLVVIMGLCLWFGTTMEEPPRRLYAGLALGASVSSALAVAQFFGLGWPPTTSNTIAGLYINSVQQGTVLIIIVVALAALRMWWWVPALIPGIALSHSRGALVALAVGLLACRFRRVWVFGVVGVAGAFYLLSPLASSDAERMQIWELAWSNLTWIGQGPGIMYTVILPRLGDSGAVYFPEYAHNDALQFAFEYGLAAVVPYAVFAYAAYRTDLEEWPAVAAFLTAGCYSMPVFMPIAMFLAFAAAGRAVRLYGFGFVKSHHSGCNFIPLRRRILRRVRGAHIPVAPYVATEGARWP